jgi:hypothetical protein
MNQKFKGQGALEYLLLIGGAVLIAVIVIALLVGMGGQSRDTAQEQADRAQQAADVPQPAQIVSIQADYSDCDTAVFGAGPPVDGVSDIELSWRPLGEGGSHKLFITNSNGDDISYRVNPGVTVYNAADPYILRTANLTETVEVILTPAAPNTNKCGDSYYTYIETTKNNQTVTSAKYRFGWWS